MCNCVSWFIGQGFLYGASDNTRLCPNGFPLMLKNSLSRGYVWRCVQRRSCCNHSRKTVLDGSFFAGRKISLSKQFRVLYFWLNKVPRSAIAAILNLHHNTVSNLIKDFYQVMQEDFVISMVNQRDNGTGDQIDGHDVGNDMQIGKVFFYFSFHVSVFNKSVLK